MLRVWLACALTVAALGCRTSSDESADALKSDRAPAATPSDVTPPPTAAEARTFSESILIAQATPANKLVVVDAEVTIPNDENGGPAAATTTLKATRVVNVVPSGTVAAIRAKDGRFYAAYSGGQVLVIDAATAKVVSNKKVASTTIDDLELAAPGTAFVSVPASPTVKKIDLATGKVLATVDLKTGELAGVAGLGARKLRVVGETLFVGIDKVQSSQSKDAYLALVDTTTLTVRKSMNLSSPTRKALDPRLPLVVNPFKNQLIVGAKGRRPVDPGLTILIDLATEEIVEHIIPSTFNGLWAFSEPLRMRYLLDHTSTPVPSTHVMSAHVEADGSETEVPGALMDSFEENDGFSLNAAQTLAMLPGSCAAGGFCNTTKGLNFIDVATGKVMPRLTVEALGVTPRLAVFARP